MKVIPTLESALQDYSQTLPRKIINGKSVFDFDRSPSILFVACVITCQDKVLILKRSSKVSTYKGKWNVIAGYYDEIVTAKDKVTEEVEGEAGITPKDFGSLNILPIIQVKHPSGRLWNVVPALINLSEQIAPVLNWENTDYQWVTKSELSSIDMVPGMPQIINQILS
jgi:isopentenyldiphosphate isomerase